MPKSNMSAITEFRNQSLKWEKQKPRKKCFRDSDKVIVLRDTKACAVPASEICIGDLVKTLYDDYQKVLYIYIGKSDHTVPVILLSFKSNNTMLCDEIGLTPCHLLYDSNGKLHRADQFKINDIIQTSAGDATITKIVTVQLKDVRSIITAKGELLLNNVRVSSYPGSAEFAQFIQKLMTPLKLLQYTNNYAQISNYIIEFSRENIFDFLNDELLRGDDVAEIKKILIKKGMYLFCCFLVICVVVITLLRLIF
eukprot:240141_1